MKYITNQDTMDYLKNSGANTEDCIVAEKIKTKLTDQEKKERKRIYDRAYRKSAKGKLRAKIANAKYVKTESCIAKRRISVKRYQQSEKGRSAKQRAYQNMIQRALRVSK